MHEQGKQEMLDQILKYVFEHLPKDQAVLLGRFVETFFATVALEDLQTHRPEDLYGAALSFWHLISERKPKETLIRVYNPDYESDGWQSTHTVIEIMHEDMPFLVDSVLMEINRLGYTTHLVIHYGCFKVLRDAQGKIKEIYSNEVPTQPPLIEEAPILVEINRQTDPEKLKEIEHNLIKVLSDVRASVEDWESMLVCLNESIAEFTHYHRFIDKDELNESIDFLRWIGDHHFTFLGSRDYLLLEKNNELSLQIVPNSGLGLLRDSTDEIAPRSLSQLSDEARDIILSTAHPILVTKTSKRSTVHRPVLFDDLEIKKFDQSGKVIGARRFIGTFTSAAYNKSIKDIPFIRRRTKNVMEKTALPLHSHAGKVVWNILETFPRDDLFQATEKELLDIVMGIYYLQERRRISFFARKDIFGRFISCLVYVPKDIFNTELRIEIQKVLAKEFESMDEISFSTNISDSVLARLHFIIRIDPAQPKEYDLKSIQAQLVAVTHTWHDELLVYFVEQFGEEKGVSLSNRYLNAFPASYRADVLPRMAVFDVKHLENLSDSRTIELNLYQPYETNALRLKVYKLGEPLALSDVMPILEHLGLRVINEHPYSLVFQDGKRASVSEFGLQYIADEYIELERVKHHFQEAFLHICLGEAENDGFNRLILAAELNWREVSVLRAYAKYFKQIGFPLSQAYIEKALYKNPHITQKLIQLFILLFDDELHAREKENRIEERVQALHKSILEDVEKVVSLDEDRIIRHYVGSILATLRTNYFQRDEHNQPKPCIAFKLDSTQIPGIPFPAPKFEIFVCSPRVEAVHLRAGKVARGGVRWSDRPEDFRTEILGLMKAQQVKNAVIVPTGAKGGFIPKRLPQEGSREAILKEAIACYEIFVRALLDLTDNVLNGTVVKPDKVVCRDKEDDYYLVVAADKGTATFSDIANRIAGEYQFWLGDAFASGGSAGYDHKKMGITAKGGWESVKRHFRERGINTQTTDFTVVGIGDMSGDVFGNGMLLSEHIKLIAAFNHLHIFIDPNPNPKESFVERKRLFELPSSNWTDYQAHLISKGGGIFSRSLKSIKLSPEMKKVFAIEADVLEPNQLIHAILKAPFDLLWNGGIGTFVKAEKETQVEVGDKTNDAIRVNATELRCKVIGEGGNLGMTQAARVEYATLGGQVYTDFIDNSAGVDCSDHEVNIKILLNQVLQNGDMTLKQRNQLLAEMTSEISQLVIQHNYAQTQAISFSMYHAVNHLELHARYIEYLEEQSKLDREKEYLPDSQMLAELKLKKRGLNKPQIAVLLAHSKILLKEQILQSQVVHDHCTHSFLRLAFPKILGEKYAHQMQTHSLSHEIIATQLANVMINEMGFTFVFRLQDETSASVSDIVSAYLIVRGIFEEQAYFETLSQLDNLIDPELQANLMLQVVRLFRRSTRWFLKNHLLTLDIADNIKQFKEGVKLLSDQIVTLLVGENKKNFERLEKEYREQKLPEDIAKKFATLRILLSSLDIIEAANTHQFSIDCVAKLYFTVGDLLDLGWVRLQITAQNAEDHWDALSREAMRDDLDYQQRSLAIGILTHQKEANTIEEKVTNWLKQYDGFIQRWNKILTQLKASNARSFTMYFVLIKDLFSLTHNTLHPVLSLNPKEASHSMSLKKLPNGRQLHRLGKGKIG